MTSHLDAHPRYAQLSHLLNLILFVIFIVTGFMIHFPYNGMPMDFTRDLHILLIWVFLFNGIIRIYWAIFSKHRDYKEFLLFKQDWKNIIPQLKYYLFLGKHPHTGKYNPMQKLAYLAFFAMSAIQFCSGALLLWGGNWPNLVTFFGGLANIHSFHYLFTWLFIVLIGVHFYLVFTESPRLFPVMFFGKEWKSKKPAPKPLEKGM